MDSDKGNSILMNSSVCGGVWGPGCKLIMREMDAVSWQAICGEKIWTRKGNERKRLGLRVSKWNYYQYKNSIKTWRMCIPQFQDISKRNNRGIEAPRRIQSLQIAVKLS